MKKLLLTLVVAGMCFGMVGCATQKPLTPEEIAAERERQIQMTTRIYEGKTPDEVLHSADMVFRLADDNYLIYHQGLSLQAQRRSVIDAAMATETWVVQASYVGNRTKVVAMHSGQEQARIDLSSDFFGGVGVTAGTGPMTNMTTSPAIYQLFFARLDNLLGKNPNWITCKEAKKLCTDANLDPFCKVATDRTPDGKAAAQRELEQANQ